MGGPLRIPEATSLALHAAALLSGAEGQRLSAATMASELGASQAHLSKVLSQLAHAGIVTSTRGPGGGYMLARSPGDVTLREIYELMDGPLVIERCPLGLPVCGGVCCPLGELLNRVGAEIEKGLEQMTLDDYRLALAEGAAGTESTTRAREGQA